MKNCPQCGSAMEKGFIVDSTNAGGIMPIKFANGERTPPSSIYLYGRLKNVTKYSDTTAYKCSQCGLIQQYAEGESIEVSKLNAYTAKILLFFFLGLIGFILLVALVATILGG